VTFCPTGGIGVTNAATYLQLSNTVCVGGSWVAPKSLVEKHDWQAIEALAQQAARMLD
jgi:2-dehydro-3-deoxyphosphogluconate aldolase/(4S)-4-hydroxy-2-oxoglutarate aldolase